jgi:transcriptional regulator GlxA family with amidase domain
MSDPERRVINVGIVAPGGSPTLDIVGPVDTFAQVDRIPDAPVHYAVSLLGTAPGPIRASSGLRILPDRFIGEAREIFDTLLVVGSPAIVGGTQEPALRAWLLEKAPTTRRIASICNGAFILAEAGLLEGRRATAQGRDADALAARYPGVRVEPDRIFVRDEHIYSASGVTAGIDLALALIEQDCGSGVSRAVARARVVPLPRPVGQSQFGVHPRVLLAEQSQLGEIADFVRTNLSADLSLANLARRAAMSERSLMRLFREAMHTTPARYVEAARVEAARNCLETGTTGIQQVAHQCGFGSTDTLRRAFLRHLGISPGDYRQRSQGTARTAGAQSDPAGAPILQLR